ncbi:MAG: hypothetical protein ACK4PH_19015 [Aquincola tertiaricarbonis]|uniref:hypothetical protein n=1 Tax=Aquincola TaxID=391952 RepID=UPI0006151AE6|nr:MULTISPECIES: hypothetical protein [Aquincola]MCR5863722.1 hypothetical protein [Aquincola sp. J276]
MVSTTSAAPAKSANDVADQAARSADSAIRSTQRLANESLDQLSDKIHELRDTAVPAINRLASEAETLARRGLDTMRERSAQIRDRAVRVSDNTVGYIKDEPVKSMLIAAATGAALMALVSLLSRSRDD